MVVERDNITNLINDCRDVLLMVLVLLILALIASPASFGEGLRFRIDDAVFDADENRIGFNLVITNEIPRDVWISRHDLYDIVERSLSKSNEYRDLSTNAFWMMEPDSLVLIVGNAEESKKIWIENFLCRSAQIGYSAQERVSIRDKDFGVIGNIEIDGNGFVQVSPYVCTETRCLSCVKFVGLDLKALQREFGDNAILIKDANKMLMPDFVVMEIDKTAVWEVLSRVGDKIYFVFLQKDGKEQRHVAIEAFCVQNSHIKIPTSGIISLTDVKDEESNEKLLSIIVLALSLLTVGILLIVCYRATAI